MASVSHVLESVESIVESRFNVCKTDEFFLEVYTKLDLDSQVKVLGEFYKKIKYFNIYLNYSKQKDLVLKQIERGIDAFVSEKNSKKSFSFLPIFLFYTSLSLNHINSELLLKPLKKLSMIIDDGNLIGNDTLFKILIHLVKIVAYASSFEEEYSKLLSNSNYECFIWILIRYIEVIDVDKMLDNELVHLLLETLPAIHSSLVLEKLGNKVQEDIFFEKYEENVLMMKQIDGHADDFFESIKKYRIKNKIIPEIVCLYVIKFYRKTKDVLRLCIIDLIRHYLRKNGIDDVSVFYDETIEIGSSGLAASKCLSIKKFDLSMILFHEATHVIQFNDQDHDKNYIGYNYSMLKDTILRNNMDQATYNRNHNRYLFEIDADIRGEEEYCNVLEKMDSLLGNEIVKRERLAEKEQLRLSMAGYLNIDGVQYDKGFLLDAILLQNLSLLVKYPVLQIEYNRDGSRKEMVEILQSLEDDLIKNRRIEEEIVGIASCIFGENYEVKDVLSDLNCLNAYVPSCKAIQEIKQKLIGELEILEKEYCKSNKQELRYQMKI